MNYELCKKLRDAGFPQKKNGIFALDWVEHLSDGNLLTGDRIYSPSLDELIETCEYKFRALMLHHNKVIKPTHISKYGEGIKWQAKPNQHLSKVPSQWGSTPEEAVAKLWLELNK